MRSALPEPALHPSWVPGRIPTAAAPVELRLERGPDGGVVLCALGGDPDEPLQVEASDDLATRTRVSDLQQTPAGAETDLAFEAGFRARFYRVVRTEP